jgi:glutamine amidotransferase
MQLLFETSEENETCEGLGLLEGKIVKLEVPLKVPHMGWNTLEITKKAPLFEGVPSEGYAYFVHSYYLETTKDIVSSYTTYGKRIAIAVQKDNVFATQFHPEKSDKIGLRMLENFANLSLDEV